MSVTISPPIDLILNLQDSHRTSLNQLSLKRLRDLVAGKERGFPRTQAMTLLARSDFPNKHLDLEAVLQNEKEPVGIRCQAAMHLAKTNTLGVQDALIRNSKIKNEQVLAAVVTALGRIGGQSALEAIVTASKHSTGLAASRAEFAAALIAHRLGMKGFDLPVPKSRDYLPLEPKSSRSFRVFPADRTDAEFCLRCLAYEPFGIEYSEETMHQIRCGSASWMLVLNRNSAIPSAVNSLQERKAFPAIVSIRSEESGLYTTAGLVLTHPGRPSGSVNLLVFSPLGDPLFAGGGQAADDALQFSLRAVSHPGAFPLEAEGAFAAGRFEFKVARSGLLLQPRRQPQAEDEEHRTKTVMLSESEASMSPDPSLRSG